MAIDEDEEEEEEEEKRRREGAEEEEEEVFTVLLYLTLNSRNSSYLRPSPISSILIGSSALFTLYLWARRIPG